MEIKEIQYFLAVARTENMHRASEEIAISPASLSKAISRLEEELSVPLFSRVGRNIKLTEHGHLLKKRGEELLSLESSIKHDILGQNHEFIVRIGASEVLLSSFGVNLSSQLKSANQNCSVQLEIVDPGDLLQKLRDGEIDLGLTTFDVPREFDQKLIESIHFETFFSKKHPLYRKSKKGQLQVDKVLEHEFVVPKKEILGRILKSDSKDGWRDDKFPRKIGYSTNSLKTIENLVLEGKALAYLPTSFSRKSDILKLEIAGCPYSCHQKVKLIAKDKSRAGWINQLF